MPPEAHLTCLDSIFYRMVFASESECVLSSARAPEGRSHHSGQRALYLSATAEGTVVAVRRYMKPNDPERVIVAVRVIGERIVDLRDTKATAFFGIDTTHRAAEWQSIRDTGAPSPTWAISDRVRELGLQGMLYASRSDPAKTHLTLFRWNESNGALVEVAGRPFLYDGATPTF